MTSLGLATLPIHRLRASTALFFSYLYSKNSLVLFSPFKTVRHSLKMAATATAAAPQFSAALTDIEVDKYEEQLQAKIERIRSKFADFHPPELEAFRSEPKHYRMRSEFRVWHDKGDLYYIMFEKGEGEREHRQVRVDQFPVASLLLNQLMEGVMEGVRGNDALRHKLYQVNFHTALSGESMVTLIYHRKLDGRWEEAARKLQEALAALPGSSTTPSVIGRSRGQKVVLGKDEVEETLVVDGQQLKYIQVEASFSQPNAGMCCSMLSWARSVTDPQAQQAQQQQEGDTAGGTGDLLELYCGNGNFTVALAPNFRKVVATEVSKSGVSAAKRNLELNGVENVFVARMSSEEFTEAWKEGRTMNRLQDLDVPSLQLTTLLVDPPRAGLDDRTVQLLRDFHNVVYISCNPDTLHRDLAAVRDAFDIKRFALFDQFPYTHHIECGVYLQRKPGSTAGTTGAAGTAAGAGGGAQALSEGAAAVNGSGQGEGGEGGEAGTGPGAASPPAASQEQEGEGEAGGDADGRGVKRKLLESV